MESRRPIAAFDSGIGSYSIVRVLREKLPNERIVYLADRASFPYGAKTRAELKHVTEKAIRWLEEHYNPKLVVLASNTPSLQLLDELRQEHTTPLVGVFPPVAEAVALSHTKHIGILATKGAVESTEIDEYLQGQQLPGNTVVRKINASTLVSLVESGAFQKDPDKVRHAVQAFFDAALAEDPALDVLTLSSTHLPFLLEYFKELYPTITFLDPAEKVVAEVNEALTETNLRAPGPGSLEVAATVDEKELLKPADLRKSLALFGLKTEIQTVRIP